MRTACSLTVSQGDPPKGCLPGGCLPGGRVTALGVVSAQGRMCTMWPIPSYIWYYLYAVPAPTETEEQCNCLYSGGHVTWQGMVGYTPLWTEFLTHACENITFPQLLLQVVMAISSFLLKFKGFQGKNWKSKTTSLERH